MLAEWTLEDVADGISVGPGGEVYVTINNSHKVVRYSPEGERQAEWEVPGVIETNGIAVGPVGEVYVIVTNSHKVLKFSPDGAMLDGWTGEGEMTGIAVGPNGLVYISLTNGLIQVFEA